MGPIGIGGHNIVGIKNSNSVLFKLFGKPLTVLDE
jgi:hypothetical protein